MQIATLTDWYKSLAVSVLITGLALAAFVAIFNLAIGAVIFAFVCCVVLYSADLAVAVPFMVAMLPFDFHRQINGQWYYLDLTLLGLAFPLMRLPWKIPRVILLFLPFFIFFVSTGAGRSIGPVWFWGYVIRWIIGLILAYAMTFLANRESVILALGASLVPLCLYAAYQLSIDNFGALWEWMFPHMLDKPWTSRAYSFFWWPNAFGNFCAIVTIMLLALALRGYRRRLCLALASTGIIGLVLSDSRGATAGLAIAFIILLFEARLVRKSILIVTPIAICLWMFSSLRTAAIERDSDEGRWIVWAGAIAAFTEHPAIGIGATNLSQSMSEFAHYDSVHAHNLYLQILTESGAIGFFLFFVPLAYLTSRCWKKREDRVALAAFLALIVLFVHGAVDYLLTDHPPSLFLFFCVVGLASSTSESRAS